MEYLVKQFVINAADKGQFEFERCLDELRQLGYQEIVKSSKAIKYDNLTVGYNDFCTEVRKLVNPSIITKLWKSKAHIELDLKRNLYYVRTMMGNYKMQRDALKEHLRRLNVILSIVNCFIKLDKDNSAYYVASPQRVKQIMEIVEQKRYALTTHIAVVSQAIMATEILITNGQTACDYAGDALYTNQLAQSVNTQVKEMSYLKMMDRI